MHRDFILTAIRNDRCRSYGSGRPGCPNTEPGPACLTESADSCQGQVLDARCRAEGIQ